MAADATSKLEILVQLRDEANSSIRRLSDDLSDLGGNFSFASNMAGGLIGALQAVGAGAIIGNAVNAFAEGEVQMARFNTLMSTLPPELQKYKEQILAVADEALVKFGFDNEEAALSMAKLLSVTRDAPFTFEAFQAAMDLARFKGISLEEATKSIIMALGGNARMLKEFGISIDDHASKQTILASIQKVVNGQAEAYSNTTKGQIEILKALGGEAQEALGGQFAPAIATVKDGIVGWVQAQGGINKLLEDNSTLISIVAALLVGVLVTGFIVAAAAALTMAGPFGLIVAAIAAIIGVVTFLVTLWKTVWPEAKELFVKVFTSIKDFVVSIWETIVGVFNKRIQAIKDAILNVVEFFQSAKEAIGSGAKNVWNSVKSAASKVIPFAEGGIVTSPTMGLVGEAGAEAIIPLSRLGSMGLGGGINITLQGDFFTDEETAERFGNAIVRVIKNQINLGGIRA